MRRLRTTNLGIAAASLAVGMALAWPMWRATPADVEPTFRLDAFREALDDLVARRIVCFSKEGQATGAPP